jgi:selenocysteine lyase/cysteine desulfurase
MADWQTVRNDFPCVQGRVFLNTGTLGPVPAPVMARYIGYQQEWNAAGPGDPHVYGAWHERIEVTRRHLAEWLRVGPETVSFAGNVTDAINIGLFGLQLRAGARVVTTDEEHGALVAPLSLLAEQGVVVDVVPFGQGGGGLLDRIEAALAKPAALVVLSHVSCETGAMVDGKALADLVHSRGGLIMLDGAQAGGQVDLDLTALDVDLYALNGHKWLLGPVGTGALYVSPRMADRVHLTFTGDGSGWSSDYPASFRATWARDGRRFEFATRPWAAWVAWNDVLDYWERLTPGAAMDRQRALASRLATELQNLPGVELKSPQPASTGITAFELAGWSGRDLNEALYEQGVVGRPISRHGLSGVRLSTAFFNNEEDVERAVAAVRRVAAVGPRGAADA